MSGDLISIGGLADQPMRAPNRRHVTGLRELAQVAHWPDDATSYREQTPPDPAEWQPTASFVVVFSQRRTGGTWERRIEAERTEVEPECAMEVWSGWHAAPVCAWMADQLGQASGAGGAPAEPG